MFFFREEKAIPKFGDLKLEERKSDQPGYDHWSLDHVPSQGIIHPSGSRLWFLRWYRYRSFGILGPRSGCKAFN